MKKEIKKIDAYSFASMLIKLYIPLFVIQFFVALTMVEKTPLKILALIPIHFILSPLIVYIVGVIIPSFYNFIAKKSRGIIIELEDINN